MNPRISFGIDYLHVMIEASSVLDDDLRPALGHLLSASLLCSEWGFSRQEIAEASRTYVELSRKDSLQDIDDVWERLVPNLSRYPEAKRQFISDMFKMALIDNQLSSEESEFVVAFADDLEFESSEIGELAGDAASLMHLLNVYAKMRADLDDGGVAATGDDQADLLSQVDPSTPTQYDTLGFPYRVVTNDLLEVRQITSRLTNPGGQVIMDGEIHNSGKQAISRVVVKVMFYKDGCVVGSRSAYASMNDRRPDQSAFFDLATGLTSKQFGSYVIKLDAQETL